MYHVDRMEAVHNELEVLEADIIGSFQMAMRKDNRARQCENDFKVALERMYEFASENKPSANTNRLVKKDVLGKSMGRKRPVGQKANANPKSRR